MRKVLSDDHYFGKKSFVTAFCESDSRPKLPSQAGASSQRKREVSPNPQRMNGVDVTSFIDDAEASHMSSPKKMLGRLREAASLAIQVTTGQKINLDKPITSNNVITGFGYALLDLFENGFVDMDSIVRSKDEAIPEARSPFASPKKRRLPASISKEEAKKIRREEKRREMEEYERREREPPKQYSLVKIKTSCGRHPVLNYISQFTADEIHEAKRCMLNMLRKPINA